MEVRPGYKQTEVGVIPEDWEVQPVRNIVERLDAGVSVNSVDEDLDTYAHSQCILKTSAVLEGRFIPHECKKIAPRDLWRVSLRPRADTILISRMNTPDLVGECGYVAADQENLFLPDRLWMTKKRLESDASIHWLSYLLCSKPQKSRIKALATGTSGSMKNIAKDSLLDLPIAVPTAPEQRAIATALSDVDALLGGLDRLIAKKRDLKQAAMQQLLTGQTRLPGLHGEWEVKTGYKKTEVGLLPNDWCLSALGEICGFENGDRSHNYPSPGSFVSSGIPFVNAGHVAEGKISSKNMNYITEEAYGRLGGGKLKAGDILFCLRGSLGKFGFVSDDFGKGAIASSLVIVRPESPAICREYLVCYFSSTLCARMIDTWSGGAAQPNLGAQDLARFSIPLPPTATEQRAIAAVLSDMDAELAALEARRDKTRHLKHAMMQELLTGRIRLVNS